MSRFFKRAQTVLAMHNRAAICLYAGPVLRTEKKGCCGEVRIFQCAKRKLEVWHTKCRTCEFYQTKSELRNQPSEIKTQCPENPTALHICPVHKLIVSPRICKACKRFPAFRDTFFAEYIRNRAGREQPCRWAGKPTGVEQVEHDGGYTTSVNLFACALHKKIYAVDCHVCKDYQPQEV